MEEEKENNGIKEESEKKKKGILRFLLISLILLILSSVGYGIYMWKFSPRQTVKEVKKVEKEGIGAMLSLEPFIFNLSGDHSKFVKISLCIEVKDEKILEEARRMMPAIRDRALFFLSSRTLETFMDIQKREEMKKEIREQLKSLFKDGTNIKQIYITDIIVQ